MKQKRLYLAALLFASLAVTGCDDNWDTPPLEGPVATIEANMTIEELKTMYWFDEANGADTIGTREDGSHYVIKGRVISSDKEGNIYKKLVIQDSNPGEGKVPSSLALSIDANSLYNSYSIGQELVIDVTGMYIGKYAGLQQMGMPEVDERYGLQMSRMTLEFFKEHAQPNGLPEPAKIDTIVTTIGALPTDKDGIIAMQNQLVRFDDASFTQGGQATFAEYQVTTSRDLTDGTGTLVVRTSGYANFYNKKLPEGTGSVVGVLGYFNGTWQLEVRSESDCIFGDEALSGTKSNPFTVEEAIAAQGDKTGWVKGVIVGAVAPGKTSVSSNSDIEWAAPFSLPNTLVLASSADVKDYTKCLVIELPQGSSLRTKANLADNADNLGSEIMLKGRLANVYGMAGIVDNTGKDDEFVFNTVSNSISEDFEKYASQANSSGWIDITSSNLLGDGWTMVTVSGSKEWSLRQFSANVYATISGYGGTAPFDSWLISPPVNASKLASKVASFRSQVNGYGSTTSKFEVYVLTTNNPSTATITKLSPALPAAPASGYSEWVNSGNMDLSSFSGVIYIGFRYTATSDANYATWCFDDLKVGVRGDDVPDTGGRNGSEAAPYNVADVLGGTTATGAWISGYIVGYVSGSSALTGAKFTAEGATALSVLLADNASEVDVANCIAVSLPSGTVRDALNLRDNPANLGRSVSLKGDIVNDNLKVPGMKNTSEYKF